MTNVRVQDFRSLTGTVRWLFPRPQRDYIDKDLNADSKDDPDGHGSRVAAKAVGSPEGVARASNLVISKLPSYSVGPRNSKTAVDTATLLAGLNDMIEDMSAQKTFRRSVLVLSLGCKFSSILVSSTFNANVKRARQIKQPSRNDSHASFDQYAHQKRCCRRDGGGQ